MLSTQKKGRGAAFSGSILLIIHFAMTSGVFGPKPIVADRPTPGKAANMSADDATKQRIDRWIKDNNRNPYGDPQGTMYAGGTPLFDERTGKTKDKYDYILGKHPELGKPGK